MRPILADLRSAEGGRGVEANMLDLDFVRENAKLVRDAI